MSITQQPRPENRRNGRFFGWRVVYGAFTVAFFSWGMGFYGPPIYLQALHESRGWPIPLISAAITTHYLSGAVCITRLPWLYARFSLPRVTGSGVLAMVVGCFGWAMAPHPAALFLATLLTGYGWAVMGGAAVNAIVSPWFVRLRPRALSFAFNGASVGGLVFSTLWVALIRQLGFPGAVLVVGAVALGAIGYFVVAVFPRSPAQLGLSADGGAGAAPAPARVRTLSGAALWRDRSFATLAIGMALGLFAQIGLLAHAFSVAVPMLGAPQAGLLISATALMAVLGRSVTGWALPDTLDRRLVAVASYALQTVGAALVALSAGRSPALFGIGMLLFGWGVGNANLLPPLIAQAEFATGDVPRAVALSAAVSQAVYAFAPGAFGLIRGLAGLGWGTEAGLIGAVATLLQLVTCGVFLLGRRRV